MNRDQLIGIGFAIALAGAAVLTYFGKADPTYSFGAILGAFLLWVQDKPAFVKKFFGGNDEPPPPTAGAVVGLFLMIFVGALGFHSASCTPAMRNIVAKTIIDVAPCLFEKAEADYPVDRALIECNVPGELLDDGRKLFSAHQKAAAHRMGATKCEPSHCMSDAGVCK